MQRPVPSNPFGRGVLNGPMDYVADWDVPSIGGHATRALQAAVETIDGSNRVDPERKIQVLLGPPGYGKTHLFGRLAHRLHDRVLFIFVPPFQDIHRPLPHIRHHVVMSLFAETRRGRSRLAEILAALCRPSFVEYVSHLPRPLDAQYAELLGRLKTDDEAVWEIIDAVDSLAPFRRIGESLRRNYPSLDGHILHALALGWSPEKDSACRWLRGESITEEHARRIGLPDDAPDPVEVLRAVAVVTAGTMPIVMCIDQLDILLADRESAPLIFSTAMMGIRSEIPNLLMVLGCLKDAWHILAGNFLAAFKDRTETHELDRLSEDDAAELVRLRLVHWQGAPAGRPAWWPIHEPSFRGWLASTMLLRPRGLLKDCEDRYETWADAGQLDRLLSFGETTAVDPLDAFRREWESELAASENDPKRGVDNVQDQRLAKALREGLGLLIRMADPAAEAAVVVKRVREDPVPQIQSNPDPYRYSFEVVAEDRGVSKTLVIALEVNHNAAKFSRYFRAIIECLEGQDAADAAILITPKNQVTAGAVAKAEMEAESAKRRLRTVTLQDYREDFARLESCLALVEKAAAQNFQLAGQSITAEECRDLVCRSGVLRGLSLFQRILEGWTEVGDDSPERLRLQLSTEGVAPETSPVPSAPTVHEPVASAPAEGTAGSAHDETAPTQSRVTSPEPLHDAQREERLAWASDSEELVTRRLAELGARVRPYGCVQIGPTFARILVTPYPATTIAKIRNRAEDLKVGLAVETLPLVSSQAGAISIDIQLPERFRQPVKLERMGKPAREAAAPIPLGQDVTGEQHWLDLADPNHCHILVAGTTGSGKSEFLKAMIGSLAASMPPERVAFALVDPKQVTFNFGGRASPYLVRPVANGMDEALAIVKDCFAETERRYAELKRLQLEDLAQWQAADPKAPPRLVLVFDEYADLMADRDAKKELEVPLKRLGAKARAAGIHLVLATQRPEASVVTPLLRSNLPARICFRVASAADSKLLLKSPDAADLLGRGDLIWQRGAGSIRLQSPYVEREELEKALFPAGTTHQAFRLA